MDEDDGRQLLDGMQSIGIVNALKTGNMHVDMVIAMCIPVVLRLVFSFISGLGFKDMVDKVNNFFFPEKFDDTEWHTRTITHVEEKDSYDDYCSLDETSQNEILIKAITMYLHHLKCLRLRDAHLKLQSSTGNSYDYYDSDDESDDEGNRYSRKLKTYKIIQQPPSDQWHPTGRKYSNKMLNQSKNETASKGEDDTTKGDTTTPEEEKEHEVQIKINEREERAGGGDEGDPNKQAKPKANDRRYKEYCLRSTSRQAVDLFIEDAYKWYVDEIKRGEDKDKSRYYYDMKDMDYGENQDHEYKRYKLSDDKSFQSMFFQERDTIVRLLEHFVNKSGKYGIVGYPYKLGLLLHGPPGTGKTSLIKAIAQYTGRSIVNIPLARIKTNAELNRLFFSDEFKYEGSYYPAKMDYKQIIFVMEDIDAASKVVQRRDGKRTASVAQSVHVDMPLPKSMWQLLLESQGESCVELVQKLVEKSERLKENAMSAEALTSLAQRMNSIPGLCVVGHPSQAQSVAGSATIKKIATDALEDGNNMMEGCKSLDEYLDFHAKSILKLLEMGTKVDEGFENELLGLSESSAEATNTTTALSTKPHGISRDVSYSQSYGGASVEVETIDNTANALNKLAAASAMTGGDLMGDGTTPATGSGGGSFGTGGGGLGLEYGFGAGGGGPSDRFIDFAGVGGSGPGGGLGGGAKKGKGGGGKGGFGGLGGLGGFGGFGGFAPLRDELNLSGLLNVLDGVVDTPGRILIMTTNHPEKLDPALIRPGRIDKKLILSYMGAEDVCNMLEHYFQLKLKGIQKIRVHDAIKGDGTPQRPALSLTPAQVEQLTAEHDDIEDMIAALEAKGKPIITTTTTTTTTAASAEAEKSNTRATESCSRITFEGSADW